VPVTVPDCAVMVAVPGACPVTWPKLVMVATTGAEDVHVTAVVMT